MFASVATSDGTSTSESKVGNQYQVGTKERCFQKAWAFGGASLPQSEARAILSDSILSRLPTFYREHES